MPWHIEQAPKCEHDQFPPSPSEGKYDIFVRERGAAAVLRQRRAVASSTRIEPCIQVRTTAAASGRRVSVMRRRIRYDSLSASQSLLLAWSRQRHPRKSRRFCRPLKRSTCHCVSGDINSKPFCYNVTRCQVIDNHRIFRDRWRNVRNCMSPSTKTFEQRWTKRMSGSKPSYLRSRNHG
jgi:hypothetical protein